VTGFVVPFLATQAPQAPDPQLLDVDGTLLVQFGLFIVLYVALKRLLWQPYLQVRGERLTRVDGYRSEAARIEKEAEARFARLEKELAEARRQASGERTVARAEAQAREATILAKAHADAQKQLADARAKVQALLEAERASGRARAVDLARELARRILGREVSA